MKLWLSRWGKIWRYPTLLASLALWVVALSCFTRTRVAPLHWIYVTGSFLLLLGLIAEFTIHIAHAGYQADSSFRGRTD